MVRQKNHATIEVKTARVAEKPKTAYSKHTPYPVCCIVYRIPMIVRTYVYIYNGVKYGETAMSSFKSPFSTIKSNLILNISTARYVPQKKLSLSPPTC